MPHFVYFLPGGPPTVKAADLASYGLGHLDTSAGISCQETAKGPGDKAGTLIASASCPPGLLRHKPEVQVWATAPASLAPKPWMVGYSTAAGMPGPDELARRNQLPGRMLEMADGRRWMVPVARQWLRAEERDPPIAWAHALPQLLQLDEEGKFRGGDVQARYRHLWDLALGYHAALFVATSNADADAESVTFDFDSAALVVEALRHNYHASAVEISLLGLFDTSVVQSAASIITDLDTLSEITAEIEGMPAKNDRGAGLTIQPDGHGSPAVEPETEAAMTTATQ